MKSISTVELKRWPNKKLSALRVDRGLSIREVAEYADVSQYALMRAEAGRAIQAWDAVKIAKFWETTVEKLWAGAEPAATTGTASENTEKDSAASPELLPTQLPKEKS